MYNCIFSFFLRNCLDFISALVGKTLCVDLVSRGAANSGLFISNEDRLHSQCIVSKLTCARWHYPCKNREEKDAKKDFK